MLFKNLKIIIIIIYSSKDFKLYLKCKGNRQKFTKNDIYNF